MGFILSIAEPETFLRSEEKKEKVLHPLPQLVSRGLAPFSFPFFFKVDNSGFTVYNN
jgi:hypothetical protein